MHLEKGEHRCRDRGHVQVHLLSGGCKYKRFTCRVLAASLDLASQLRYSTSLLTLLLSLPKEMQTFAQKCLLLVFIQLKLRVNQQLDEKDRKPHFERREAVRTAF